MGRLIRIPSKAEIEYEEKEKEYDEVKELVIAQLQGGVQEDPKITVLRAKMLRDYMKLYVWGNNESDENSGNDVKE